MQDSNLRIHESKSCALPTWLIPNIYVVSAQGFEPRTHALEGRCSIQLSYAPTLQHKHKIWSGKRDSNSRLQPWQGCALPLNYSRSFIKLNKNGADEGSRTPTPMALDPKSSASANSATSAHFFGGGWWIRTTEVDDNRFTVCPLWPLGKSSVLVLYGAGDRNRTYNLLITSQLLYR